jgi:hypothetical protein
LTPAQPDRFWRRFAVVIACVIFIPAFLVIAAMVAAMTIPAVVKARARAVEISAPTTLPADVVAVNGEFHKHIAQSFPLNPEGRFHLDNINGRVEIHGWSSNLVEMAADIHGQASESLEAVKIQVNSDPSTASVHTEERSSETGFWSWLKAGGRNNATVDYVLHVPSGAQLNDISSVNGAIEIEGVGGNIGATTVNGKIRIQDARANLNLSTVNGSLSANMIRLNQGQSVKFNAVNGAITLGVPDPADAKFTVTTVNGHITSDFPSLQPKKEFPVGNNLNGRLGEGKGRVEVDAVNSTVHFVRAPTPKTDTAELPDPQ